MALRQSQREEELVLQEPQRSAEGTQAGCPWPLPWTERMCLETEFREPEYIPPLSGAHPLLLL